MAMIKIAVDTLEFDEGGNTIWVHSPRGLTVLRLKTNGQISMHRTQGVSSHCDVVTPNDIDIFIADADQAAERPVAPSTLAHLPPSP